MHDMNYVELVFYSANSEILDIVIAELSICGYNGFEESTSSIKAFIREDEFDKAFIQSLSEKYHFEYSSSIIQHQNWNQLWESNFEPLSVANFVGVRAAFHQPIKNVLHEIIITPKMSFGTGHHATTYMMMQLMAQVDFKNKSVLDFGTGTGILAILSEKLGANKIFAIDYDDWCIENALENVANNNCKNIEIRKGDSANVGKSFEVIVANINRNIILDNIDYLVDNLYFRGILLLSGLLKSDELEIKKECQKRGLIFSDLIEKDGWTALKFIR
jgi:ribosomal protein L11 methyltransferase